MDISVHWRIFLSFLFSILFGFRVNRDAFIHIGSYASDDVHEVTITSIYFFWNFLWRWNDIFESRIRLIWVSDKWSPFVVNPIRCCGIMLFFERLVITMNIVLSNYDIRRYFNTQAPLLGKLCFVHQNQCARVFN